MSSPDVQPNQPNSEIKGILGGLDKNGALTNPEIGEVWYTNIDGKIYDAIQLINSLITEEKIKELKQIPNHLMTHEGELYRLERIEELKNES